MEHTTIGSEDQARQAIEAWKKEPTTAQLRNLRLAVESLELSQMYYEQKENEQGIKRTERCIAILRERINGIQNG